MSFHTQKTAGGGVDTSASRTDSIIPLRDSFLCVDCENVTHAKHGRCLKCDSTAVVSVSVIVGGPLQQTRLPFIRSWSFGPASKCRSFGPKGAV